MTLSQTQLGLKVTLPLHISACISMKNHTNASAGSTSSAENTVFITQAVDGEKKNSTTFRKRFGNGFTKISRRENLATCLIKENFIHVTSLLSYQLQTV